MRSMKSLCALSVLLLSSSAFAGVPFVVEKIGVKSLQTTPTAGVLFEHNGYRVKRALTAKPQEFASTYVIHLDAVHTKSMNLAKYGRVLHQEDATFAIMNLGEAQVESLNAALHHQGMACGALFKLNGDVVAEAVAAATPIIPVATKITALSDVLAQVSPERIKATVVELSTMETRRHDSDLGKTVADRMAVLYQAHVEGRQDVTIETFDHGSNTPQPSLVVRIKGKTKPDEIIVLGSHIDSINHQDGRHSPAPGADDNASGTATNLEVFRLLMEKNVTLERTLEIHGYAAEEMGLVGSQDMATKYKRAGKNVISMVQHDMNLHNADNKDEIYLVSNNTNAALNTDLSKLIEQYVGVPWKSAPLYAGNSDHYSWTRQGFPAAFPFENPAKYNNAIHTKRDTIETAGRFTQAAAFAKLGLAYIAHFGGWNGNK